MSEPLFSASWYRVKDLTPRLRPHARIHRHVYRGETWYVLQDASRTTFHRFPPSANAVIGLMDGRRRVEEVWQLACDRLGDDAPTQDEMIRLMGQLHAADALQCDVTPDVAELFERWERAEKRQWLMRLLSPLAIRIPLVDPERFLARTVGWVRPLFSGWGFALWLAVVSPALGLAGVHWDDLTHDLLDQLFTPLNLAMIWCLFPVIKALHELGHGYAAKAFGGEVHDMGVMFLVFAPVPYVDASSTWSLPSKYRRALVGAAGMLVELFFASLAFYLWLAAEPGAVRAIAHNAVVIAGFTTLVFNANPLLRFDGYYILSDWIEIPNLRARANQFVGYLVERFGLGRTGAPRPPTSEGEPAWLVGYAVAAFLYRAFIVVAIGLWILDQFLLLGIALGAIAGVGWFGVPLWRGVRYLFTSPALASGRGRALAAAGGALALALLLLFALPFPLRTRAEGVVWIPEDALVRSSGSGFVVGTAADPGSRVEAGDLLLELRDPELESELRVLEARTRELEAVVRAEAERDRRAAQVTREALAYARRDLARARERIADLAVRSQASGTLVMPRASDRVGRFVHRGEVLARVVDLDTITVRVVVPQDDIDLVRRRLRGVRVRLAERLSETHEAVLRRVVPAASDRLPSPALSSLGGGRIPIDPTDREGFRAAQSFFEVDLELPAELRLLNVGGRVYVRFDHGSEPLGWQWARRISQLFLSRFHV